MLYPLIKGLCAASVPIILFAALVLGSVELQGAQDSPQLVMVLNNLFLTLTAILIAAIAAWSFGATGRPSMILLGGAALAFGAGSAAAGLLMGGPDGTDTGVTVHNSMALVAAVLYVCSALLIRERSRYDKISSDRGVYLAAAYGLVLVLTWGLMRAAGANLLPHFIITGTGPTLLRQVVLATAIVLFAISSLLFYLTYFKTRLELAYWYALALALFALGLWMLFQVSAVNSPLIWLGRGAEYLGAGYLLIGILTTRSARGPYGESIPLPQALTAFLGEWQENYRALIEAASDAIIAMDERGRILLWNPAAERIYGFAEEEALGQNLIDLVVPEPYAAVMQAELSEFIATHTSPRLGRTTEIQAKHRSGAIFPVEFNVSARETNVGFVGTFIVRDISERRRAEDARRMSEERLNVALKNIPIVLFTHDTDLRYTWFQNFASEQIGGDVLGKTDAELFQGRQGVDLMEVKRRAMTDRTGVHTEVQLRTASGERYYDLRVEPLYDYDGQLVGVHGASFDITERHNTQVRVQSLNRDLERRARDLAAVNKELESFSYSVSHDLRMPLASIDNFARVLLDDYAAALPPDAQTYLGYIRESATAMGELIEGLLALSRVQRQPLKLQTVVMDHLVREALDRLYVERQGRSIEIRIGDLPDAQGDPVLLKQVWMNLLSNAFKFTREREFACIEIGSVELDGYQVYYVQDNGVGFDMENAAHLFGVFQRLHSEEDYAGHGIGLATVQRILHRHGGCIWAEAELDNGATFYFNIGPTAD